MTKPRKPAERCRDCRETCGFVPGPHGWVRCGHPPQPSDGKALAIAQEER